MRLLAILVLAAAPLAGHVGSPDVFFDGKAGPYTAAIAIRPPGVIPGVAEVEIRINGDVRAEDIRGVRVVPLPLTGIGADHPPTSDVAIRSKQDPLYFTCSVWLMASGSFQVRVEVNGTKGTGRLAVPVPAVASLVKTMDRTTGFLLSGMLVLLVAGIVTISGAAIREGGLAPHETPSPERVRKSRLVMTGATVLLVGVVWFGRAAWNSDEKSYLQHVYKPLVMTPTLDGSRLNLAITDPFLFRYRKTDDFIPDHGHLMHLFLVRVPALDRMWHLHPDQETGGFALNLPSVPAGRYKLFADVVHANGFAETLVAETNLPNVVGRPLSGDDSEGSAGPVGSAERTVSPLPGGYRMVWEKAATPLKARQLTHFTFRLEDGSGRPATDMQLYMGMQGHAEFMSADGSVFAHVHPDGSVPMAALMLTRMPMQHAGGDIPPAVSFPYGFPKPGLYRIFVQMQRAGQPVTGVFDALVG